MKNLSTITVVFLALVFLPPVLRADEHRSETPLYFPPDQGGWETVPPASVGWDATSARDLARFGLMMQAGGRWGDKTVLSDQQYLWWLNRNSNATTGARRLATAPEDMFSANGALNRRCFVVPSLQLVVTRLGDSPDAGKEFDRQFWKLLVQAAPAEHSATRKP